MELNLFLIWSSYHVILFKGVESSGNTLDEEYRIGFSDFYNVNSNLREADYYSHVGRRHAGTLHRTARAAVEPTRPGEATETHTCNSIRAVPSELRRKDIIQPEGLNNYYQKYTEAYGIPVIASSRVSDDALRRACYVTRFIFAGHSGIRKSYFKYSGRVAVIGKNENTTDLPEHSHLEDWWNLRARGLGATTWDPICSAGEENLLCILPDRYRRQDIFLHELVHGVQVLGGKFAIAGWDTELSESFDKARKNGLWDKTYAATNYVEYFAEGTQSYFNVNDYSDPPNGINNHVNTREKLKVYDPSLYKLIQTAFPCDNTFIKRCEKSRGMIVSRGVSQGRQLFQEEINGHVALQAEKELQQKLEMNCDITTTTTVTTTTKPTTTTKTTTTTKPTTTTKTTTTTRPTTTTKTTTTTKPTTTTKTTTTTTTTKPTTTTRATTTTTTTKPTTTTTTTTDTSTTKPTTAIRTRTTTACRPYGEISDGNINKTFTVKGENNQTNTPSTSCQADCSPTESPIENNQHDKKNKTCQDTHTRCRQWAATGVCTQSPKYMLLNCNESCGACRPGPRQKICVDYRKECRFLSRTGGCKSFYSYMSKYCKESCNFCDVVSKQNYSRACVDKSVYCQHWVSRGHCGTYQDYMSHMCRRSCKICKSPEGDVCRDLKDKCLSWATSGECIKSRTYMNIYCRKSCKQCALGGSSINKTCVDLDSRCTGWAAQYKCSRSSEEMATKCRKSCNWCQSVNTNICTDLRKGCQSWAATGECSKSKIYMGRYCQKSCKTCNA